MPSAAHFPSTRCVRTRGVAGATVDHGCESVVGTAALGAPGLLVPETAVGSV